jgi:predicted Ser/Thr protein kinase
MAVEDLKQSPMMNNMLEALDRGEDIGHYGRLTFAMVARYFMDDENLVQLLAKDGDTDENKARALVQQVEEKGYNSSRRDRIVEW